MAYWQWWWQIQAAAAVAACASSSDDEVLPVSNDNTALADVSSMSEEDLGLLCDEPYMYVSSDDSVDTADDDSGHRASDMTDCLAKLVTKHNITRRALNDC